MATPKVKLFAITTVIFAIFGIVFFALSVTSIGKYKGQKTRVEHLEHKILAGKTEMLKVPEMIGKLRVADKAKVDLDVEIADLTVTNEELTGELQELQKENTILSVAKAVLETDKAGYTKNLVEARQAVEELRQKLSTNDGGSFIEEDLYIGTSSDIETIEIFTEETSIEHADDTSSDIETSIEETSVEHAEDTSSYIETSIEETSVEHAGPELTPEHTKAGPDELQSTLNLIKSALQSTKFMFSRPEERFEELKGLITKAEAQSESRPEISRLLKEFAGKVSSSESTMSEILASLDEAMAKL